MIGISPLIYFECILNFAALPLFCSGFGMDFGMCLGEVIMEFYGGGWMEMLLSELF